MPGTKNFKDLSIGQSYEDVVKDPYMRAERVASGQVDDDRFLVAFLYLLARDHLPVGVIEQAIIDATGNRPSQFTNGWLAEWAKSRAEVLT